MKRTTALRYAAELHRRVTAINGLLATPGCNYEAIRISRMWIFGSTIKGKAEPNDLDLLIEWRYAGRRFMGHQARPDPYWRRCGMRLARDASREAYIWLTRGMRRVSRHNVEVDGTIAHPRVLIYPRFDLAAAPQRGRP